MSRALPLGAVFLVALALRAWGTSFGLPTYVHPDEPITMERAQRMIERGDPNPHYFNYPPLTFYVQAAALWAGRLFPDDSPPVPPRASGIRAREVRVARMVNATIGALTVVPTFLAAREIAGSAAGFGAAGALAITFLHVQQSQYVKPDVPSAFFVALCMLWSLRALVRGEPRWLARAGAAAGLAAATKYNAGASLLLPLVAAWGTAGGVDIRDASRALGTCARVCAFALGAFLLAAPWILLDPSTVATGVQRELTHYSGHQIGGEAAGGPLFFLGHLWWQGLTPGLSLLVLWGFAGLARSSPRTFAPLAAFPLAYVVFLGLFPVKFTRNLLPVLPVLAVAAGLGFEHLRTVVAGFRARRPLEAIALAAAAAIVVVGWPVTQIVLHDFHMAREQTFTVAARELDRSLPDGARLCVEHFTEFGWNPRLTVQHIGPVPARANAWLEKHCDFVATSSFLHGPVLASPDRYPLEAAAYRALMSRWPLYAEFRYSGSPLAIWLLGEHLDAYDPVIRAFRAPTESSTGQGSDGNVR